MQHIVLLPKTCVSMDFTNGPQFWKGGHHGPMVPAVLALPGSCTLREMDFGKVHDCLCSQHKPMLCEIRNRANIECLAEQPGIVLWQTFQSLNGSIRQFFERHHLIGLAG